MYRRWQARMRCLEYQLSMLGLVLHPSSGTGHFQLS
ncbi:hypothetical protein OROGR_025320 [Orobanche gracilis]